MHEEINELPSKSQKKREATELQKMGVSFIALSLKQLEQLALPEALLRAILDAKTIKSHVALRRQEQLIGKRMREVDYEAIKEAYEALVSEERAQTVFFHEVEQWRERLIHEGTLALKELLLAHPNLDRQALMSLIKKAIEEKKAHCAMGAGKALFRFLREELS